MSSHPTHAKRGCDGGRGGGRGAGYKSMEARWGHVLVSWCRVVALMVSCWHSHRVMLLPLLMLCCRPHDVVLSPLTRWFLCLFICLSVCLFICLSVCLLAVMNGKR